MSVPTSLTRHGFLAGLAALALVASGPGGVRARQASTDPLPSWNAGAAKAAITAYVDRVTRPGPDFVPVAERIAVFDNDGTLWAEQPMYFQFTFAFERVGQLVAADPALRDKPAFRALADWDAAAIAKLGDKDLLEAALATQAGLTPDEYVATVTSWLAQARHPRFGVPYTALTYRPQLELMAYLRVAGNIRPPARAPICRS